MSITDEATKVDAVAVKPSKVKRVKAKPKPKPINGVQIAYDNAIKWVVDNDTTITPDMGCEIVDTYSVKLVAAAFDESPENVAARVAEGKTVVELEDAGAELIRGSDREGFIVAFWAYKGKYLGSSYGSAAVALKQLQQEGKPTTS